MRVFAAIVLSMIANWANAQLTTLPIPGAAGLYVTVGRPDLPLAELKNNPMAVNVTMADDDNRLIPLGFSFPYFSQTFTQSWMHSNGVVSFQNPTQTGNFCCQGQNLTATTASGLNYSIMPLWTDLIAPGTNNHYYLQSANEITYGWYGVNQYGTQNANSFEVKLNSTGLVDVRLQGAMISAGTPVTSGMTGNLSAGEYFQYYYGSGWNTANSMNWAALNGTNFDAVCNSNPLASPTCPNYAQAFLNQQCTISPLYNPQCPGYAAALFIQQCSISALYDPTCPGYQQAYFNQQCEINPLYSANCPGYAKANFDKQCEINALYDSTCPNYNQAYALKMLFDKPNTATVTESNSTVVATVSNNNQTPQTPATTTVTAAAPAAPVQLVPQPVPAATLQSVATSQSAASSTSSAQTKEPVTPTRAQQIQRARQEAARKEAAAKANEKMAAAKEATSMEQQVAVQDQILTAMGYNAQFDVYNNLVLRDAVFYKPVQIYPNSRPVDNLRALRGLTGSSDQRFNNMVDQQYK